MAAVGKREVGDLLFERGLLDRRQLEQARRRQARLKIPQHRAIVELNHASEEDTYQALAEIEGLDFVDLDKLEIEQSVLEQAPLKLILHYHMLPIALEGEALTIAFSELPSQMEQGNLRLRLGKRIRGVLTTPSHVHAVIKKRFGLGADSVQKLREERSFDDTDGEIVFDVEAETDEAADVTISAFVDQVLMEALRLQATDIHLEPYAAGIALRYRIDGLLQKVPVPDDLRRLYPAIVSRLKIMASLNIAEKRLPQDGRIAMKADDEDYDLRVSTVPTKHGEAVCLRILGRQSLFLDLGQLGMETAHEALYSELTRLPQGLVLVTGPTGSGKTTTLYAGLAHANDEVRKTITIEDPIEYHLPGITQIQVKPEIGLTFAGGLRSILRHDPDVVLIGEIRDVETAEISMRAAQTGHLVFSTLHTNDSVSAVARLLEMKIDPFLVANSLICSLAQRLARRICRNCREPLPVIPEGFRREMVAALSLPEEEVRAWQGRGCVECNSMGARGRTAIYEFFLMNDVLADAIVPGVKTGRLRELARRDGWRSLRENGLAKVQEGVVSPEEIDRITRRIDMRILKPDDSGRTD